MKTINTNWDCIIDEGVTQFMTDYGFIVEYTQKDIKILLIELGPDKYMQTLVSLDMINEFVSNEPNFFEVVQDTPETWHNLTIPSKLTDIIMYYGHQVFIDNHSIITLKELQETYGILEDYIHTY